MPLVNVPPRLWGVLTQNGVTAPVFHTYNGANYNDLAIYHFTFDPMSDAPECHDIRDFVKDARGLTVETLDALQGRLSRGELSLWERKLDAVEDFHEPPYVLSQVRVAVDPEKREFMERGRVMERVAITAKVTYHAYVPTYPGHRAADVIDKIGDGMEVVHLPEHMGAER